MVKFVGLRRVKYNNVEMYGYAGVEDTLGEVRERERGSGTVNFRVEKYVKYFLKYAVLNVFLSRNKIRQKYVKIRLPIFLEILSKT